MNSALPRSDVPRTLFSVLFIVMMLIACLWIVQPFVLGFTWATMAVIATWPVLIWIQKILWGKRSLAVMVMTLLLLVLFVAPISMLVTSVVENSSALLAWSTSNPTIQIPELNWLKDIPLFGDKLYSTWHSVVHDSGGATIWTKIQPYIGQAISWIVAQAAHLGSFLVHCAMMVLFSALLYSRGDNYARSIRHFAIRMASSRGDAAVILAGQAIRAVALGVVVTAIVQSVFSGLGLLIVGIPYITVLTVVMFICCVAQIGPLLVLLPAVIWLYWSGDNTLGTVLLVWSMIAASLDTVLRPMLIRLGADLPALLVLCGVIGGLLAFGMIGLFIGPVVLAVSYRLIRAWMDETPQPEPLHQITSQDTSSTHQ